MSERTPPDPEARPAPPAESGRRIFLAVFDDKLRRIPVGEGTLLIGRSRDVHLRIHDHLLSRKHCALTLHPARRSCLPWDRWADFRDAPNPTS